MKKIAIVFAGCIFTLAVLTACGAGSASSQTSASSAAESSAAASEASPASEPEEAEGLAVGEAGDLEDWGVTVTNFEITDRIDSDYGIYFSPDEGNHYGVVYLSVTNNGKEAANFLPTFSLSDDVQAEICFGDGYEFSATNLLGHSEELHDSTLNPLTTKEGFIVFSLPDAVTSSEEPLSFKLTAGSDTLTYMLR